MCFYILCFFISGVLTAQQELIFEDNFEGEELRVDAWNYELGDGCPDLCGWGNNERQIYTQENVQLKNGNLVIKATHDNGVYKSAKITTKDKVEFTYGTIEVRAQLATGKGVWPAIWLLGANIDEVQWPTCGEIDMMEYVGKEPHVVFTSIHTAESFGATVHSERTILPQIESGFHVYKTRWTEDEISFFIDDRKVYTYQPRQKVIEQWPFGQPFYIIMNIAIGGDLGGPEVDDSIFPQEFLVDYILIYKNS
ncbi:MAG: glycoside hydrolase family 16 protein [Flavobacteriaceae bacterium]|nr:glycoside hydrolase family 16 protein [Flavobacteriaceae bacterium]